MKAPKPVWLLKIQNLDVTEELAQHVVSVEYTDVKKGGSDELTITVQNRDRRWLKGWFPQQGDRIDCKLGYEGEPLLDCGEFQFDQLDFTTGTDVLQIRALAAAVGKPVRTRVDRAFENVTLRDIAQILGRELALEVVGDVADVKLGRITQKQTTLAFLHQLAEDYGYAFSIRGDKLVFFEIAKLDAAAAVLTIDVRDIEPGARFSAKAANTYQACELSFFDAQTKKSITVRVEADHARQKAVIDGRGEETKSAAPTLPTSTLRLGSKGDDVTKWQTFLASRGIDTGAIDGAFGPVTRASTLTFQRQQGLAADGIAGPETYRAAASVGFGAPTGPTTHSEVAGNVLRLTDTRVENVEQAELKARAALSAKNRVKSTGSGLTMFGRPRLVAGATMNITGIGNLDGKFCVEKSVHKADRRSGYKTTIEVTGV